MPEDRSSGGGGNTWTREVRDDGEFVRGPTTFRASVSADGSAAFPAEAGRYHLYVSLACPWAHRTLIGRALKGLADAVSVDVVHPILGEEGWSFDASVRGSTGDRVHRFDLLRQVYRASDPGFDGRVTVPVLWDRKTGVIVNNESAEILRMLNSAFQPFAAHPEVDLYPEARRADIDAINEWVYADVNNGVYRCGFARTQQAYSRAFASLFDALDRLEAILGESRFLVGGDLTEADVRLFTTLVRFDAVYVTHFKCNLRRIVDYPNLWGFTRDVYQQPGVAETVDMDHIKRHYYESHRHINPSGIVPDGPELDFGSPHGRG